MKHMTVEGVDLWRVPQANGDVRYLFRGTRKWIDRPKRTYGGFPLTVYEGSDGRGYARVLLGGRTLKAVIRNLKRRELLDSEEWAYHAAA